jgi:hypothetical protein
LSTISFESSFYHYSGFRVFRVLTFSATLSCAIVLLSETSSESLRGVVWFLIDKIEQKEVYEELERLKIDTEPFKKAGLSHQILREILIIVKQSQRSKLV